MSERDPCENPLEMLSQDVETEFLDSMDELEERIAADLRDGRVCARSDDDAVSGDGHAE